MQQRPQFWFAADYEPVRNGSIDGTDIAAHDRGLARAARASYRPEADPKIQGDPYKTLFVSRLSYSTTEETVSRYFSVYGSLARVRLVRDLATGLSRGYAFVEFEHETDFVAAFRSAHRQELDGAQILVDYERERVMPGWKPRRVGGGLGGKKESGQLRFGGRDRPFHVPVDPFRHTRMAPHPQSAAPFDRHPPFRERNDGWRGAEGRAARDWRDDAVDVRSRRRRSRSRER